MSDLRKAAEMALEALETLMIEKGSVYDKSIQALRQALAQPEQKPVAWGLPNLQDPIRRKQALLRVNLKIPDGAQFPQFWVPLYTAPPKREWVSLTDEQFLEACQLIERGNYLVALRRVQAKLKEKNG